MQPPIYLQVRKIKMNAPQFIAIAMIIAGGLGLAYGGFDYTKKTHQADVGPIHVAVNEEKHISVPIWAGVGLIIVGGFLLAIGKKS